MSQNTNGADHVIANQSGALVRADINNVFEDIVTSHSGTSAPTSSNIVAGSIWYDTTASQTSLKVYNGSSWESVGSEKVVITSTSGAIAAGANTDIDFEFGRSKIGSSIGSDTVYLSHYDHFSTTGSSIIISSAGKTYT
jgi:hypothetical protein